MKEDATSKKFLVSQFNNYQMKEDCSIMEQFNVLERILGHFKMHNMNMDETIIVSSIIDKHPTSWKDFKHSLKHKEEDLSLEELANSIRIEEEFRKQEENKIISTINVVESSQPKKRNCNKIHDKKNKKRKVCWDCDCPNHLRCDCPNPKKKEKKDFNKSKSGPKQSEGKEEFAAMISEVFMIQDENSWWIDSGTTRHNCKDKACFMTYEVV